MGAKSPQSLSRIVPVARDEADAFLSHPVTALTQISEKRSNLLGKMGIVSVRDLLLHVPFRYLTVSPSGSLGTASEGEGSFRGTVHEVRLKRVRPKLTVVEVSIVDDTGVLVGVWFNQPWMAKSFAQGDELIFSGVVSYGYGLRQMNQPYFEILGPGAQITPVVPVHPVTDGLSTQLMRRFVAVALAQAGNVPEILPLALAARRELPARAAALHALHFPSSLEEGLRARDRFAYEELLVFELHALSLRRNFTQRLGYSHVKPPVESDWESVLPFSLSHEQRQALDEIWCDMYAPTPMHRLLMGDVGTGKTVVALGAMTRVAYNHTQVAMMAPTEVLARQYAYKVGPLLDALGISWALLTGATSRAERTSILERLASGELTVLFGTHALIQPDVVFKALTLAIIDEQHRFGVNQRGALTAKGTQTGAGTQVSQADVLLMSATPIPRTLQATAYGDLDVSVLKLRPVKGGGITTRRLRHHQRNEAFAEVHAAIAAGHQAYVICALVEEAQDSQIQAAERIARELAQGEFASERVGLLTGRMGSPEKEAVMADFAAGDLDILVATTVVEVGIDVPNATVMVVLDADRYGSAQLHQLRGRVGRGDAPGLVYLVSDSPTPEAAARFEYLEKHDDGFEVAQFDLEQRGPGELLGRRQHGELRLKIADLARDGMLVEEALEDAIALLGDDPSLSAPENALLKREYERYKRSREEMAR